MTFSRPELLALLLLVPVLWFVPRRVQNLGHGLLRSIVVTCLVVASAGPLQTSAEALAHHVFVVDGSDSVSDAGLGSVPSALSNLLRRTTSKGPRDLILIGRSARTNTAAKVAGFTRVVTIEPTGGVSPLGEALETAAELIPDGVPGSVILVSDGEGTTQDWGKPVATLTARGIPLHTVRISEDAVGDDTYPSAIHVEETIRVGQTTRVGVDLIGNAPRVSVELLSGSDVLARRDDVPCNGRTRCSLNFEPKAAGNLPLTVRITVQQGQNARDDNDTLSTVVAVQEPLRVLYLGHRMIEGGPELQDLLGRGFSLDTKERLTPSDEQALSVYDLVVMDDRPASTVPESFQRALSEAVREHGLGLCFAGGGASFGAGGYHDSPLASTFPVEFVHKEEKKDPSTALAIIIDTSGSMGGNRIRLAKEVARLAMRRLLPHDKVGIVEFYGTKRWAAPLQSAANSIDIQRAINRLDAGGGTVLMPAVEEAYYGLRNVQTRYKHVLVLTDAGVETGPYEQLLRRMARDGICVSTVLVGPGRHAEFLVQLADWGNGRYYNASNRFNLPEVMLKQPSTARLPSYRPGAHPLKPRGGLGWWGDTDPSTVPSLAGYVESQARPGADVVLETEADGHPVLASWTYGLGRVTTLLTEPTGPGTEPWRSWGGYGSFLARVLTRTASDVREPFRYRAFRERRSVRIQAEARVPTALVPTGIRPARTDGGDRVVTFVPRAPLVSSAEIFARPDEEVTILCGEPNSPSRYRLVSPALSGRSPEHQVDPQNFLDLNSAARATGGDTAGIDDLSGLALAARGASAPMAVVNLAPQCLLLALLAYLADILTRRWPKKTRVEG